MKAFLKILTPTALVLAVVLMLVQIYQVIDEAKNS